MLKEVGASGQISLGKKYVGQLFELTMQADGCIVMRPVKVVPASLGVSENTPTYADAQKPKPPPLAAAEVREWAEKHAADVESYNAWASEREPYAQRVRRWREQAA